MQKARVATQGRLTIPLDLRRKYGIKPGTKVCFIERGGEILFQPVTKAYIRTVCGMLKSKTSVTQELLRERQKDNRRG